MAGRTKRIAKEIEIIYSKKDDENTSIFISCNEDDITDLQMMILGPKDTVFEHCFMVFSIIFPHRYPLEPPKFKFITPQFTNMRLHPNLYGEGKVCLDILNTWSNNAWAPIITLEQIGITIQSLMDNDPAKHEPGFRNGIPDYSIASRYLALQCSFYIPYKSDVHLDFREFALKKLTQHEQLYLSLIEKLDSSDGKIINTIHHKNLTINVPQLKCLLNNVVTSCKIVNTTSSDTNDNA